jgi:hypothetical protein
LFGEKKIVLCKPQFYQHLQKSDILTYDTSGGEDSFLQECDAAHFGGYLPKFRRIAVHPFSAASSLRGNFTCYFELF